MKGSLTTCQRRCGCLVKSWMLLILIYPLLACHLNQHSLRLISSADVNANTAAQGLSVLVHAYVLSERAAWQQMSLSQKIALSMEPLPPFVLAHQSLLLAPSTQRTLALKSHPRAKAIAVVAHFHQLNAGQGSLLLTLRHPRLSQLSTHTVYVHRHSITTHP